MNCPKCKNMPLKKKEFNSPYFCSECGGLWLESKSIDQLHAISEQTFESKEYPDHDSKTGLCPQGHGILTRAKIDDDVQSFYLEKCSKCYGIWFDKGEWQRVAETHFKENFFQIWSLSWQREQRNNKKQAEIVALFKERLSPELYDDIINLAERINKHPERHKALTLLNEKLNNKNH